MTGNLSRKQMQFLRALLVGKTVVAAARLAEISERTAFYWLKNPVFAAEKVRCETLLAQAEMDEIKRLSLAQLADVRGRH